MRVVGKEFIGALKAARLFVSEDPARESLHAVHLERTGGTLRVVATDGHTLWCCEVYAKETVDDPPPANAREWNVLPSDVDAILKAMPLRSLGSLEIELSLEKHTVDGVEYAAGGERFCPYRNVIPALASQGEKVPEFSSAYFARACEALALYGTGLAPIVPKKGSKHEIEAARGEREWYTEPSIAWRAGGEHDPVFVYSPKFPCAFALIMPRRAFGGGVGGFVNAVRLGTARAA
jgi:hypothetical protein